jgi:O-antigen/teichoic acid export membrane protein
MNIGYILDKIKVTFLSGHERSVRANKNIALSFFLKVLNVAIQFLFVPILLGYLSPIKYGVWVTIGSVINWLYFFDVGLGNGLRNRLAEAL